MLTHTAKSIWQHWLSAITVFVMVCSMITVAPAAAAPVEDPEPRAPLAPTADQTLGGVAGEGNLRITVYDSGRIGIERYDAGSWSSVIYDYDGHAPPDKGSRFHYTATTASKYFFGYYEYGIGNLIDVGAADSNTQSVAGDIVTTTWSLGSDARVTQTVTYNNGDDFVRYEWAIQNITSTSLTDLRFFHGQDTFLAGDDHGAGFWLESAQAIGVRKTEGGEEQRFYLQGITAPYAYESSLYSDVYNHVNTGELPSTVDNSELIDNGYALEWRQDTLAPGDVWTIIAYEGFSVRDFDAVVIAAPLLTEVEQGASANLDYIVTNDDDTSDVVDLTVTTDKPAWTPTIQGATSRTVPDNSSGSITVTVRVTVPAGATIGDTGAITLTTDSDGSAPNSSDKATVKVTESAGPTNYTLTINKDGTGDGSVTKDPDETTYTAGTVVTLTAVPSSTSTFDGWDGAGLSGTTNPVTLTMDANKEVTATFNTSMADYTLTIHKVGDGSVTKDPAQATYSAGSAVKLTAIPSDNYFFYRWTGDLITKTNPATVTMDANKTITATFLTEGGDDDGDGVPNEIEDKYDTDPTDGDEPWGDDPDEDTDPTADDDGDDVTNAWEEILGTDPDDPDSDSDKTTPDENDNDVSDADEDFDGDGIPNDIEIKHGTDPLDPNDPWGDDLPDEGDSDPTDDDDGDGVTNAWEEILGTDPDDPDSDSDKTTPDENDNDVSDADEDFDGDGVPNDIEIKYGTDPLDSDDPWGDDLPDEDSNPNGDDDGDGVTNAWEEILGTDPDDPDSDSDKTTPDENDNDVSDADEDFDGDGIPNDIEIKHGTDPLDPDDPWGDDPDEDTDPTADDDGDGVTNAWEEILGTDPDDPDSDSENTSPEDESDNGTGDAEEDFDGDGISNAAEIDAGTDPLDGTDNDALREKTQTLVDASDDPADGAPIPQDLLNTGLTNVITSSMGAYEEGFADPTALGLPEFSEPPTRDELQAVIDAVNGNTDSDDDGICDATELDAGTDPLDGTDNDDDAQEKPATIVAASDLLPDGWPTRQDLLNTGLTSVYTGSMPAYERGLADPTALGLLPYSEPPTQAELQAVIDAVNALDSDGDGISDGAENDAGTDPNDGTDNDTITEKVQTLVDASDDPADGFPTVNDLINTGLTDVISDSMDAYEQGFADPTALDLPAFSEPPTQEELQAVIDAVNRMTDSDDDGICDATELDAGTDPFDGTDNDTVEEKVQTLVDASDDPADGAPTAADLTNSGLDNVIPDNMDDYEQGFADPVALGLPPFSEPPTQEELQAVIDAVNALNDSDGDGICDATELDAGTDPLDETDNDTVEEKVQTLVDASDDPADGAPTAEDLTNTGLDNVLPGNMDAYEEGFADPTALGLPAFSEPPTQEELQAVIDAVNGMTDSDNDGICDATELDAGTDPLDGTDNDTPMKKAATLVDASDDPADGFPTVDDLANTGLTHIITGSMAAYEEGFADPTALGLPPFSEPPTVAELQAVIDAVNGMTDSDNDGICDATELDAGTDPLDGTDNDEVREKTQTLVDASDDPADGAPTPQDLTNTGLDNVIPDNMDAYEEGFADPEALGLPPFSEPPTLAELQAVIDAVNGMTDSDNDGICDATELEAGTDPLDETDNDEPTEKTATLVAASDLSADGFPTVDDLTNTGLTNLIPGSMPAYEAGFADPTALGLPEFSDPPTVAELQAVIDAINALDSDGDGISDGAENDAGTNPNDGTDNDTVEEKVQTLVDASDNPADGFPTPYDLLNTGLKNVLPGNMDAYEQGFADPTLLGLPAFSDPPTQEELQAVIDAVNGSTDSDNDGISDAAELDAGTDPNDGTDNDTVDKKVQTLVDASDDPADGAPTAQDLINTGLENVIPGNLDAYEEGFADPVALGLPPFSEPPTQEELQAVIDAANRNMLALDKTAEDVNGAPLEAGDLIRYTIYVTNTSNVVQTNVLVTDTLPAGVTPVGMTPILPTGSDTWQVGTLNPGATWTAVITMQVEGSISPIGGNVAAVSSDLAGEQQTDPILPPGGGEVVGGDGPTAQDDNIPVPEGVASTLDVLANDSDPNNATLTITQVTAPGQGTATTDGKTIIYTATNSLGEVTFTYTITDGEFEDSARVTVTISAVADLAVEQEVIATIVGYDFIIVARNPIGPRPAPGAVISDTFPNALSDVTWECDASGGASCENASGAGQVLNETLPSFPVGGVVTYTVSTITSDYAVVYNTVTISPSATMFDLNLDNNSATVPTRDYRLFFPLYVYLGTP